MGALLETRELAIGYRGHAPLACELSLRLMPGKMVCLLGRNGVGKSTLLRTLAGLTAPLDGAVLLHGEELRRIPPSERARRLTLLLTEAPQNGLMSGYELVALGRLPHSDWLGRLTEADHAAIERALIAVDAHDLARRNLRILSDGQRQKLMIARALAQDTALILLDEPTAFLDFPNRVGALRLLKQLTRQQGKAILLSTHEVASALRHGDEIWLMTGAGMRVGAPADLTTDGSLEAAFGMALDTAAPTR